MPNTNESETQKSKEAIPQSTPVPPATKPTVVPPVPNVYPIDQPTIIIGPNTIRHVGGPVSYNQATPTLLAQPLLYQTVPGGI